MIKKYILITILILLPSLAFASVRFGRDTLKGLNKTLGDFTQASRFGVEIDGVSINGVTTIKGLEHEHDVVEYQDGDDITTRKRPGSQKPSSISITKDFSSIDHLFFNWRQSVINGKTERKSVSIIFHNDAGEEAGRINFFECYPTKWTGPNLNARNSANATEKIVLSCSRFTIVGNTNLQNLFSDGAVGNLDGDNNNGSFGYRSANQVGSTTGFVDDPVSNCKDGIPAGEVQDCAPNVY